MTQCADDMPANSSLQTADNQILGDFAAQVCVACCGSELETNPEQGLADLDDQPVPVLAPLPRDSKMECGVQCGPEVMES